MAIMNAWILYKKQHPRANRIKFIGDLIQRLVSEPPVRSPVLTNAPSPMLPPPTTPSSRLPSDSLDQLQPLPGTRASVCAVCCNEKDGRRRTRTCCPPCSIGAHKDLFGPLSQGWEAFKKLPEDGRTATNAESKQYWIQQIK